MTYIISFISQKGGVGKSTLARSVAQELKKNDYKVRLADLDVQQGTSQEWHRRRLDNDMHPVGSVECFRTTKEALDGAETFDGVVIDGAGRSSKATYDVATISDIVIQPTGASLDDLVPAVRLFHELVQKGIENKKLYIALSRIGTAAEEEAARDYIAQAGYQVLNGCTFEKPAYRMALNAGQTITETRYDGLNDRADQLMQSIFNQLQ